MHELPFVQSVISRVLACAAERGAVRVLAVSLTVGEVSGYVPESIQMYFDIAARGTPCEGAALRIKRFRPLMRCEACGKLFDMRPTSFDCPACGGAGSLYQAEIAPCIDELELEIAENEGEINHEGNDTRARDGSDTYGERPAGRGDARGL